MPPEQDDVEQSVSPRFSRAMNATCSPLGMLTDPAVIGAASAVSVMVALGLRLAFGAEHGTWLYLLAAAPLLGGLGVMVALSGGRKKVVGWLQRVPFPVHNVNGLLHGVAQTVLIRFAGARPPREEINLLTEAVHDDCFALSYEGDEPEIEVRVGVPEGTANPTRANHERLLRVQRLVDEALVPLSERYPIAWVRIC